MSTTTADTPPEPTHLQKLTWHAMNTAPAIGVGVTLMSKSFVGVIFGIVLAVGAGFLAHRWRQKGLQHAGAERLRVGPVTPLPPNAGSPLYGVGVLFFAMLTVAMPFLGSFQQLTRVGMTVMLAGVTVCFVALMYPKLHKLAMVVFGMSMLAGGVLILLDAKAISDAGGEYSVLNTVKTAFFGGVVLFAGIAVTWGVLRSRRPDVTPLYDNGWYGQWGFMPWSALRVSLNESNGQHQLEATAFNGWTFQMPVSDDRLDAARQLLTEIDSQG